MSVIKTHRESIDVPKVSWNLRENQSHKSVAGMAQIRPGPIEITSRYQPSNVAMWETPELVAAGLAPPEAGEATVRLVEAPCAEDDEITVSVDNALGEGAEVGSPTVDPVGVALALVLMPVTKSPFPIVLVIAQDDDEGAG
jgi:hypothetical protein